MVNKHKENAQLSSVIKEVQIETTIKYHYIPTKIVTIPSTGENMEKLELQVGM